MMRMRVSLLVDADHDSCVHVARRLEEEGAKIVVVGAHNAKTKYTGKYGYPMVSDAKIDDVDSSAFDGLVIPGGFAPDYMRRNAKMLKLVVDMIDAGKPVASICHGPWMLCSARRADGKPVVHGVKATGFAAIKGNALAEPPASPRAHRSS